MAEMFRRFGQKNKSSIRLNHKYLNKNGRWHFDILSTYEWHTPGPSDTVAAHRFTCICADSPLESLSPSSWLLHAHSSQHPYRCLNCNKGSTYRTMNLVWHWYYRGKDGAFKYSKLTERLDQSIAFLVPNPTLFLYLCFDLTDTSCLPILPPLPFLLNLALSAPSSELLSYLPPPYLQPPVLLYTLN